MLKREHLMQTITQLTIQKKKKNKYILLIL